MLRTGMSHRPTSASCFGKADNTRVQRCCKASPKEPPRSCRSFLKHPTSMDILASHDFRGSMGQRQKDSILSRSRMFASALPLARGGASRGHSARMCTACRLTTSMSLTHSRQGGSSLKSWCYLQVLLAGNEGMRE